MKSIYVEGGAVDSKELQSRCREAFSKLLERCGFKGRLPRIHPCGSRTGTFHDFKIAHKQRQEAAMLVDSEDPVKDIEQPWNHLKQRDGWDRPRGAADEQALLMTTCMETWIAADRGALKAHYGPRLQESSLPKLQIMEQQLRHDVQSRLSHATRNCGSPYAIGKASYELLGKAAPAALEKLPSFARMRRILDRHL